MSNTFMAKTPSKQGGRVFLGPESCNVEGPLPHSLPLVAPKVDQWQRVMQLKEVSKDTATCNAVLQLQWKKGIRWVHSNVLFFFNGCGIHEKRREI